MVRNEEDVVTAAIEGHRQAYGMGDARAMARFVLELLAKHKAGKASEPVLGAPDA